MELPANKDGTMESNFSNNVLKPQMPVTPSDDSSRDSSSGDDEWRPSRREPTRKVNPLRSRASKLMWKRRKAAALFLQNQMAQESVCAASASDASHDAGSAPGASCAAVVAVPSVSSAQPVQHPSSGAASSRFSVCWSDTTLGSASKRKSLGSPLESSAKDPPRRDKSHLNVRPVKTEAHTSSSVQGAQTAMGLCIKEEGAAVRHNRDRACRPKMFQRSFSSEDSEEEFKSARTPPQRKERACGSLRESAGPSRPKLRPTLLQRKSPSVASRDTVAQAGALIPSYMREDAAAATSRGLAEADLGTRPCSKHSRMSMAAKLRWEKRKAKMNLATTSASAAQQDECCEIDIASLRPKVIGGQSRSPRPIKLPAKLRLKQRNYVVETDCVMPAKLRLKHERMLVLQSISANGPLQQADCSSKVPPPERSDDGAAAVPHPFPKFQRVELFAEAKRRTEPTKVADSVNGSEATASTNSRRSVAMKESWRKRKERLLSPATLDEAKANQPVSVTCEVAEADPTDSLDCASTLQNGEPLPRRLALWLCRQRRRHAVYGQVIEPKRGTRGSRLYTNRGVHIASNTDACDCMTVDCPGCHFPCPKCGSSKCGDECRCNRTFVYETLELDGYSGVLHNPLLS